MFIRTKVVKGFTYYQVVRAERDGARVRQVIVAALGRNPTVEAALKAEKRSLARLRRDRGRWPEAIDPAALPKTSAARLARLDERIEKSSERIDLLTSVQKTMKADAKNRARRADEKTVEG